VGCPLGVGAQPRAAAAEAALPPASASCGIGKKLICGILNLHHTLRQNCHLTVVFADNSNHSGFAIGFCYFGAKKNVRETLIVVTDWRAQVRNLNHLRACLNNL